MSLLGQVDVNSIVAGQSVYLVARGVVGRTKSVTKACRYAGASFIEQLRSLGAYLT